MDCINEDGCVPYSTIHTVHGFNKKKLQMYAGMSCFKKCRDCDIRFVICADPHQTEQNAINAECAELRRLAEKIVESTTAHHTLAQHREGIRRLQDYSRNYLYEATRPVNHPHQSSETAYMIACLNNRKEYIEQLAMQRAGIANPETNEIHRQLCITNDVNEKCILLQKIYDVAGVPRMENLPVHLTSQENFNASQAPPIQGQGQSSSLLLLE